MIISVRFTSFCHCMAFVGSAIQGKTQAGSLEISLVQRTFIRVHLIARRRICDASAKANRATQSIVNHSVPGKGSIEVERRALKQVNGRSFPECRVISRRALADAAWRLTEVSARHAAALQPRHSTDPRSCHGITMRLAASRTRFHERVPPTPCPELSRQEASSPRVC